MARQKYIGGLVGWEGYSSDELLEGKYRPLFGEPKIRTGKNAPMAKDIFGRQDNGLVYVPATRENLIKARDFTEKYSSYSEQVKEKIRNRYRHLM